MSLTTISVTSCSVGSTYLFMVAPCTPRSVMVEVEPVSVQVGDRELREPPRLLLQGLDDVRSRRLQLAVDGIDVFREHPVDRGLERRQPPAEKDHDVVPR